MAIDVTALVQALRQNPDQQAALREALGIPDVDVRRSLDELAQAQHATEERLAQLTERVDQLGYRVDQLGQRVDQLGERVDQLAQAQARTEARLDQLGDRVDQLAQAQARTEARLDELAKDVAALTGRVAELTGAVQGLVDVVSGMQDRLGQLSGTDLERRYRERGPAYLLRLARRLALVASERLAVMVDDAEQAGALSATEVESLMVADAVFSGRRRSDGAPIHLVVEVSVTVGHNDVRRARERADLLARIVDTPVLAVVAGEYIPEPVAVAAQDAEVWCVMRGRVLGPDDDPETLY